MATILLCQLRNFFEFLGKVKREYEKLETLTRMSRIPYDKKIPEHVKMMKHTVFMTA